ncbi:MAG TPA: WG repeat-containing protein [Anaerovoracaceae bacterium]|nr:WG repeat-containing protein [Anaerovoracaceae bacterium]
MMKKIIWLTVFALMTLSLAICTESTAESTGEGAGAQIINSYGYIYPSSEDIRKTMSTSDNTAATKFGYIDEEGNIIAECKYDTATDFMNGIGVLKSGNTIIAINTKGKTIKTFDSSYSAVEYFDGKKGIAQKDGKSYLIDQNGDILNKTGYTTLYQPQYGQSCILAQQGNLYGFIDWNGNILTHIEYLNIFGGSDSSGIVDAMKKDGKHGYISENGKVLVPAIYDYTSPFSEGIGILWKDGKVAFVNTKGKLITKFVYDNAQYFHEGLGGFMKGDANWGYIDKTGKEVIPATYANPADFINGYANIQKADESYIRVESPIKKYRKINVYLNDKWIYLDQEPMIKSGRSLAPIRGIAEALGYYVTWDAKTNTATLQNETKIIKLSVGSQTAIVNTFDDKKPAETIRLDAPAELIGGRILVPIRFLADNIGAEVKWNGSTQTISIKTTS